MRAIEKPAEQYCNACFTGDYPLPVPESQLKLSFERSLG
jgi:glutamine phosphoribosylpyrophosphate amidotransferase